MRNTSPTLSWGLALSGGAAWGLANLGVLDALREARLKPHCIAGSSMGAIVGALFALGYSPKELHAIIGRLKPLKIASFSEKIFRDGLHGGVLRQELDAHLRPLVGNATIADCVIPFLCIAGKVREPIPWHQILKRRDFTAEVTTRVEPYVFPPKTKLLDALRATSAIPVIFSPVKIGHAEFIDLVAFGALPARTLREHLHPEIVIGTDCNPKYEGLKDWLPKGWRGFVKSGVREYKKSQEACDILIQPTFKRGPFRFDRAQDYVEAGKEATIERILEIQKLINIQN